MNPVSHRSGPNKDKKADSKPDGYKVPTPKPEDPPEIMLANEVPKNPENM